MGRPMGEEQAEEADLSREEDDEGKEECEDDGFSAFG